MGDAAGQLADHLHLACLVKLREGAFALGEHGRVLAGRGRRGVPSRTQPRRKPRPGFRRETATKADSFAGVNRYSRQIARISLLAIPAGLLALGCGPYLMRQR